MADSQSIVEILLKIKSEKTELAAVQAQIAQLNAQVAASTSLNTANAAATNLASGAIAQWSPRALAAAQAGTAWNQASNAAVGSQLGLGTAIGKTSANFAPATAAMRAASVAMKEAEINGSSLTRNLALLLDAGSRLVPGMNGLGSQINLLGRGFAGTSTQLGIFNALLVGSGIAGLFIFAGGLASVISKGIELQKTLQDVRAGVAGTLVENSDKFGQGLAQKAASQSITELIDASRKAQVPVDELAKGFDAILASATRANAPIDQQIKLLSQLFSIEDQLHIPQTKIIADLNQILNAQVSNTNALAARLGLTKEEATAARAHGDIIDVLIQKEKDFAAANDTGSETIARAQQKVKAAFDDLALTATGETVAPLTKALDELAAALNDPSIQAGVAAIVSGIVEIATAAANAIPDLVNFAKAVADALNATNKFTSDAGKAAHDAVFGKEGGVLGLGNPNVPGTPAYTFLHPLGSAPDFGIPKRNISEQGLEVSTELSAIEIRGGLRQPIGGAKGGGGGGAAGPSIDTLNQQKIAALQAEINEREAQYHTLIEQNNAAHLLGTATLGQQQKAAVGLGNTLIATLDDERAKLVSMRESILALGVAQGGLNDKESKQVDNLQQAVDKLDLLKARTQVAVAQNTFIGSFTIQLRQFTDTLLFTGQRAAEFFAGAITTGIDATSQALTGLIFQTRNWAQVFVQAGEAIVQSLIKIALQAVVGLALQKTISAGSRADSAREAAAGVFASASHIPYIGWIIAPIAAAAAFAAVLAFKKGGIVPGSPSDSDNVLAHVSSGEGIITSQAVQYYGPETIHAMNRLEYAPKYAQGGIVGSSGGTVSFGGLSPRPVHVNMFADASDAAQHILSHPDAQHMIVDIMRKNRFQIKV